MNRKMKKVMRTTDRQRREGGFQRRPTEAASVQRWQERDEGKRKGDSRRVAAPCPIGPVSETSALFLFGVARLRHLSGVAQASPTEGLILLPSIPRLVSHRRQHPLPRESPGENEPPVSVPEGASRLPVCDTVYRCPRKTATLTGSRQPLLPIIGHEHQPDTPDNPLIGSEQMLT
ncbi:uncharacterized protein BO80DRAFT_213109 [Aspergillus ibericus CBS 121593]|uniref:Uncharacterized protein n=1 Tax=Aspergillus ibericus CBS 121593 TaxID=1448316 RepID=A0A395GSD1_9EURO|nr:hypothetical protein BO80DRAFT_213109 [Aspergillus ibericus CBS 121593]RAK96993.1 hypothetical protein BO80DRAFT_213109 [Aspergillus ibericus CBS 121593]